jgi:hypothetical protein
LGIDRFNYLFVLLRSLYPGLAILLALQRGG